MSTEPWVGTPGYISPEVKKETHYAVRFMYIAIIMLLLSQVLSLVAFLTINQMSYGGLFDQAQWGMMILFSALGSFFGLIFFVMIIISLYQFHRGRLEFDTKHSKDVKIGLWFILIYFILIGISVLLPLTLFFMPLSSIVYFNSLWQVFYVLESFFIGLGLLFLARSFANKRERDLLYLFTSLIIGVTIIDSIIEIGFFYSVLYSEEVFSRYILYGGIRRGIMIFVWFIGFLAYYLINRSFDPYDRFIAEPTKGFLPKRPKPVVNYVYKFYSKPVPAFLVMLVIAIVIGAGAGFAIDMDIDPDQVIDEFFLENERQGSVDLYEITDRGSLNEYAQEDRTYSLKKRTYELAVHLTWMDESDERFLYNEPDTFTLSVNCIAGSDSATAENQHGEMGYIDLLFRCEDTGGESPFIDRLNVTITLENAGDQTTPFGLFGRLNQEDNSNNYDISIECKCIVYEYN
jgi:hypothetical protein